MKIHSEVRAEVVSIFLVLERNPKLFLKFTCRCFSETAKSLSSRSYKLVGPKVLEDKD